MTPHNLDLKAASQALKVLLRLADERGAQITRTKAVKLLYLADLRSIRQNGVGGSGIVWLRDQHGPFNRVWYDLEDYLKDRGEIVVRQTTNSWTGEPEYRLTAPLDVLETVDIATDFAVCVATVVREYGAMTATEAKNAAYETAPMREEGEEGTPLNMWAEQTSLAPKMQKTLQFFKDIAANRTVDRDLEGRGCSEDILIPFREARKEANRLLLSGSTK